MQLDMILEENILLVPLSNESNLGSDVGSTIVSNENAPRNDNCEARSDKMKDI